jgi:hypothetical protein
VDPDAVVARINSAASRGDWGEVDAALYDLAVWIDRGGFFPSRKITFGEAGLGKLSSYYQNARDTENARRIVAAVNKNAKANPTREAQVDETYEPAPAPKKRRGKAAGKGKKQSGYDSEKERKRLLRKINRI